MKQPWQKNVYVAVPETGGHDEALAVDYRGAAWDFDLCNRSNQCNVAVVYKDCAVFDWWFRRGEINLCANQGELGRVALESRQEGQKQKQRERQSNSHVHNIRYKSRN